MPVKLKRVITLEVDEETWEAFERVRELWGNQDLDRARVLKKMTQLTLEKIDPDRQAARVQAREENHERADQVGQTSKNDAPVALVVAPRAEAGVASSRTMSISPPEFVTPANRYIPTEVRRTVWTRDDGRCSEIDRRTGLRCASRYALQFHHADGFAYGGSHAVENLQLLCRAHHRAREKGRLG